MNVGGKAYRTIRPLEDGAVEIIDQTVLPERFRLRRLATLADVAEAIVSMRVRGAPLIGVTAAYGMAMALRKHPTEAGLKEAYTTLRDTRPTAANLQWALNSVMRVVRPLEQFFRADEARRVADKLAEDDVATCRAIGEYGAALLAPLAQRLGRPLRVMTHCNAGWLAAVDYGTALAPVYLLHGMGIPVEVWVSETRPRNQGYLTAWELAEHGVPYCVVVDSACGHLIQTGEVDVVLVGTDRTTRNGHVANKIGTYLKALAAHEARIPFYVAAPSSSIDFAVEDARDVTIEERSPDEVTANVDIPVRNPSFDVTPAHLVTKLITERGVCDATREALAKRFPDRRV